MGEERRIDDRQRGLRLTLEEIERLLAVAQEIGAPVEPWVEQLASELRANLPTPTADGARVAGDIRSNPQASMGAQSRLDAQAIKALKS